MADNIVWRFFHKWGGVSIGNINIEMISFNKGFKLLGLTPRRQGLFGIAFEPCDSLHQTIIRLKQKGITFSRPRKFRSKGEHLWTNVNLNGLLSKSWIFCCLYEFDIHHERKKNKEELLKRNGGQ